MLMDAGRCAARRGSDAWKRGREKLKRFSSSGKGFDTCSICSGDRVCKREILYAVSSTDIQVRNRMTPAPRPPLRLFAPKWRKSKCSVSKPLKLPSFNQTQTERQTQLPQAARASMDGVPPPRCQFIALLPARPRDSAVNLGQIRWNSHVSCSSAEKERRRSILPEQNNSTGCPKVSVMVWTANIFAIKSLYERILLTTYPVMYVNFFEVCHACIRNLFHLIR